MSKNLLSKPMNELTKTEREFLRNELNEQDKNDIRQELENVRNQQEANTAEIETIKEENKKQDKRMDKFEEDNCVLGHPTYAVQKRQFNKKAKARVEFLLGGKTTPEYLLFRPFFSPGIYASIAYELECGSWLAISMIDWDKPNSMFEKAKEIRDNWRPSRSYFTSRLNELIEKRDNGVLSRERCVALTNFLNATDNGKNVWFL